MRRRALSPGGGPRPSVIAGKRHRGENRRVPGAEVLGGELLVGSILQVLVDLRRPYVLPPRGLPVNEQLRSSSTSALQGAHRRQDQWVVHHLDLPLPSLGAEVEFRLSAPQAYMSLAERSQTIGIVLDRVLLATDPKEPQIEGA